MFTPSPTGALARAATIVALQEHTQANHALPARAKALAGVLLDEGRLSSKTTNAELVERLGPDWYERKAQRAFRDLEHNGYGTRKPGANTPGCKGFLPPLWVWHASIIVKCHPVISYSEGCPNIASEEVFMTRADDLHTQPSAQARGDYWARLHEQIEHMPNGELGEMRYNAIRMRRLEESRGSGRAKFWQIQEYIYAGALADRGIIQPAVILLKIRTGPI